MKPTLGDYFLDVMGRTAVLLVILGTVGNTIRVALAPPEYEFNAHGTDRVVDVVIMGGMTGFIGSILALAATAGLFYGIFYVVFGSIDLDEIDAPEPEVGDPTGLHSGEDFIRTARSDARRQTWPVAVAMVFVAVLIWFAAQHYLFK